MNPKQANWITTYTGRKYFPLDPDHSQYCIEDIAHALSLNCRFGGHIPKLYTVAQHSSEVAMQVAPALRLDALLHDAAEAYLLDLPRGLKHTPVLEAYRDLELRTLVAIHAALGVPYNERWEDRRSIKWADNLVCRWEAQHLGILQPDWDVAGFPTLDQTFVRETPSQAERRFLRLYRELTGIRRHP
jgi:hypothetical protein